MKKALVLIGLIFMFGACINLKSPYPDIKYYSLGTEPLSLDRIDTLETSVQLRNLTINDEYDTDFLLATKDQGKEILRYFYHRWTANFADLATGALISRANSYGVFMGGLTNSAISTPNFILEGRVLSVISNNSEKLAPDANWTELTINISLFKREDFSPGLEKVFNKTYSQRIYRKDNLIQSIPPAMSKAVAIVSDMIIVDVHNEIKNNSNKK